MITAQTHCRGAAQFLLCKNTTSRVGKYCAVHCAYTAWLSSKQVRAVGGASPYTFVSTVCPPQNHCRSLRILLCIRNYKSGAEFTLRHRFVIDFSFAILLLLSTPLSRLAPIEALPISCERSRTRNLLTRGFTS